MCSIVMLIYLIGNPPLTSAFFNAIEIFNELCILTGSYILLLFADGDRISSSIRFNSGWAMVAVMIFNIAVNFTAIISKVVS